MAGEQMTDREAALAARIKELEDAQTKNQVRSLGDGALESVWRLVANIVPPSLVVAGLAVLVAHYGFGYFLQSQITAAETQLKQAKSDVEAAKAKAANAPVGDIPARLAALKAEYQKNVADAAAARVSANALRSQVNGESAALASAKANLDNLQQQARGLQIKADAAGAKFGLSTLREREVRANLIIQKLKTIAQRNEAAGSAVVASGNTTLANFSNALMRSECEDNEFAEEIGCPAQFIRRKPQPALVSTSPTEAPPPNSAGAPWAAGQSAAIKTVQANLRPCPEITVRCKADMTINQGVVVKIRRVLPDGWAEIEIHDEAARGTWHGFIKTNVLEATR